jgi:hypothetical protein
MDLKELGCESGFWMSMAQNLPGGEIFPLDCVLLAV